MKTKLKKTITMFIFSITLLLLTFIPASATGNNSINTTADISITIILEDNLTENSTYENLFKIKNELYFENQQSSRVIVNYSINKTNEGFQEFNFTKIINSYSSTNTGSLDTQNNQNITLCGKIIYTNITDINPLNNNVCQTFEIWENNIIINNSNNTFYNDSTYNDSYYNDTIYNDTYYNDSYYNNTQYNNTNETEINETEDINLTSKNIPIIQITTNKYFFEEGEQVIMNFGFDCENECIEYSFNITYWIEDLFEYIIKQQHTTTNTNPKTHTIQPLHEKDAIYKIVAFAVVVDINSGDIFTTNKTSLIMIRGSDEITEDNNECETEQTEEENIETLIEITALDIILTRKSLNVKGNIQKGDTLKRSLSLYGTDNDDKKITNTGKFSIYKKNSKINFEEELIVTNWCDITNIVLEGLEQEYITNFDSNLEKEARKLCDEENNKDEDMKKGSDSKSNDLFEIKSFYTRKKIFGGELKLNSKVQSKINDEIKIYQNNNEIFNEITNLDGEREINITIINYTSNDKFEISISRNNITITKELILNLTVKENLERVNEVNNKTSFQNLITGNFLVNENNLNSEKMEFEETESKSLKTVVSIISIILISLIIGIIAVFKNKNKPNK